VAGDGTEVAKVAGAFESVHAVETVAGDGHPVGHVALVAVGVGPWRLVPDAVASGGRTMTGNAGGYGESLDNGIAFEDPYLLVGKGEDDMFLGFDKYFFEDILADNVRDTVAGHGSRV